MFEGIPVANLTASTLLGIAILFLLLGRIVPRSALTDKIEEAQRWQKAYETEAAARAASDAQTAELLELAKTTHNIIVAMFETTEHVRQSGVSGVVSTTK